MKGLFLILFAGVLAFGLYAGSPVATNNGQADVLSEPVAVVENTSAKSAEEWFSEGLDLWFDDRFEEASVAFTRAIELNPQHVKAYNLRAWMYYMLDRYEEALADYTAIIHMESVEQDDLLEAFEERGNLLCEMNLYAEAIADYTEAIRLDPEKQDNYERRERALESLAATGADISEYVGE
jgi:tetratricopeptide (TPR) repeat protein